MFQELTVNIASSSCLWIRSIGTYSVFHPFEEYGNDFAVCNAGFSGVISSRVEVKIYPL
jgi:hypothetical protein